MNSGTSMSKTLLDSIRPCRSAHSGGSSAHCPVGLASVCSLVANRRRPGPPRAHWIDQLCNDTEFVPANLWRQAILWGCGGTMW